MQPVQVGDVSSEEDDNQEENGRSVKGEVRNNQGSEDEDYSDEQYPSADDRYKQLEDRLKAMEVQKIPGLDFPGGGIPPKFKVHVFAKYDGVSYPKLHLRSYIRKIQTHTVGRKLWVHFFQESLVGTQLE